MPAAHDVRTHYRTCNLCEAMCGLEIKVTEQEILSIKGDQDDPFSQGHIVRSRAGEIVLPIEISDDIMPGVVSIPHGWGHHRPGIRLATAQQHAGASINDLTDEQLIDELTGNAALSGVPVSVSART